MFGGTQYRTHFAPGPFQRTACMQQACWSSRGQRFVASDSDPRYRRRPPGKGRPEHPASCDEQPHPAWRKPPGAQNFVTLYNDSVFQRPTQAPGRFRASLQRLCLRQNVRQSLSSRAKRAVTTCPASLVCMANCSRLRKAMWKSMINPSCGSRLTRPGAFARGSDGLDELRIALTRCAEPDDVHPWP